MSIESNLAKALLAHSKDGKGVYVKTRGGDRLDFYHEKPSGEVYYFPHTAIRTKAHALYAARALLRGEYPLQQTTRQKRAMLASFEAAERIDERTEELRATTRYRQLRGNPTPKTVVKFLPEDQIFIDEATSKARSRPASLSAFKGSGPTEATISLRRVPLNGAYDKSGRYFGLGAPLYIAELEAPDGYDHWYLRARSREVAKALAHIRFPHAKATIR